MGNFQTYLKIFMWEINQCLKYDGNEILLSGFTGSNLGGSETDGRITTSGCFSLGSAMISLMSKKQDFVALSSAEVEHITTCAVRKEVVWLRKLLTNLFGGPRDPTMIFCEKHSSIRLN